jgi:hypothetical protein
MQNRGEAKKRNAVKLKENLQFPEEVLYLFAEAEGAPAKVKRVTAIHLFESSP